MRLTALVLGRHGQDGSNIGFVSPENTVGNTVSGSALKPYTARVIPS